jgi:hypothetical protein
MRMQYLFISGLLINYHLTGRHGAKSTRSSTHALKLDRLSSSETSSGNFKPQVLGAIWNYVNFDIDTIWQAGNHEDTSLPRWGFMDLRQVQPELSYDKWNNGHYYWAVLLVLAIWARSSLDLPPGHQLFLLCQLYEICRWKTKKFG